MSTSTWNRLVSSSIFLSTGVVRCQAWLFCPSIIRTRIGVAAGAAGTNRRAAPHKIIWTAVFTALLLVETLNPFLRGSKDTLNALSLRQALPHVIKPVVTPSERQNVNFSASCMFLGKLFEVVLRVPKVPAPKALAGRPKFGVFVTLNASARNCNFFVSFR